MQISFFSVSVNVFSDESAETYQIDKKIRSKNNVQQSNIDRIVWSFNDDVNDLVFLNEINRFVDSQLIFRIDTAIKLKSWWIIADMNIWRAIKDSAVQ